MAIEETEQQKLAPGRMIVHSDCRHFRGDRPCAPHKAEGVKCDGCIHYDRIAVRILIVKLDAVGDVLRTTCVLDALHAAHPGARIEWLTRDNAAELLDHNPLVERVYRYPDNALVELLTRRYDLVINLDNSPLSSQLASLAQGRKRIGFGFHPDGHVEPLSDAARVWFEMGLFDDVKRSNIRTYQEIVLDICGLPSHQRQLHLYLSADERSWARSCAVRWGIGRDDAVIGLNTGCGARWPHKKWTEDGYVTLIEMLHSEVGRQGPAPHVLLLGGPEERERNARIAARSKYAVIDTGCDHTLRRFCSLVDLCDVVVTGDTLALHAAAALGKRVVALFGPTSVAEIDLYERGIKLVSDAPCVGGYRTQCDVRPTCMERILPQQVFDAVSQMLDAGSEPRNSPGLASSEDATREPRFSRAGQRSA